MLNNYVRTYMIYRPGSWENCRSSSRRNIEAIAIIAMNTPMSERPSELSYTCVNTVTSTKM